MNFIYKAKEYAQKTAIVSGGNEYTYQTLFDEATLFAKILLLPMTQSCATWVYAINKLSLPISVTPLSWTVPLWTVTPSLKILLSPIINLVSSPSYFLSGVSSPIEEN